MTQHLCPAIVPALYVFGMLTLSRSKRIGDCWLCCKGLLDGGDGFVFKVGLILGPTFCVTDTFAVFQRLQRQLQCFVFHVFPIK